MIFDKCIYYKMVPFLQTFTRMRYSKQQKSQINPILYTINKPECNEGRFKTIYLQCLIQMINNYFSDEEYHHSDIVYSHPVHRHCLHLGDISSALDTDGIFQKSIRTVITAAAGMDHIDYDSSLSIKHIVYPLLDIKSENISKHFTQIYELIESGLEVGSVLVHCAAGVSRSATLVIAYLMKHKNWSFREAIAFVRKNRPTVCPNLGFQRQLKQYQNAISRENRSSIQRRVPRTSEEQKHMQPIPHIFGLPDIVSLGRTQLRQVMLDPFAPLKQPRTSQHMRAPQTQRNKKQLQEQTAKLRPLKVKRTTSLMDRRQRNQREEPLLLGLDGMIGVQSVFVRRLNLQKGPSDRMAHRRLLLKKGVSQL